MKLSLYEVNRLRQCARGLNKCFPQLTVEQWVEVITNALKPLLKSPEKFDEKSPKK